MAAQAPDHTGRFTGRAEAYDKFRDSYSDEAIDHVFQELGFQKGAKIMDMGSGTGILSRAILSKLHASMDLSFIGLEPNDDMRAFQDKNLEHWIQQGVFESINGTAEASGLPDHCADGALAAAAFHWFDPPSARKEIMRVVKSQNGKGAPMAILTRMPRKEGEFPVETNGSEVVMQHIRKFRALADPENTSERRAMIEPEALDVFFGSRDRWTSKEFPTKRRMTWDHLSGLVPSFSFTPASGSPEFEPFMSQLKQLFDAAQVDGCIELNQRNQIICGFIG